MKNSHLLMLALASTCFAASQAGRHDARTSTRPPRKRSRPTTRSPRPSATRLKDNAKDVCQKEAEGQAEDVAKAELEQQYKPSDSAGHARSSRGEGRRPPDAVAKEKCDDHQGEAKAACVKQAKADEAQGKADIKAMKKTM